MHVASMHSVMTCGKELPGPIFYKGCFYKDTLFSWQSKGATLLDNKGENELKKALLRDY